MFLFTFSNIIDKNNKFLKQKLDDISEKYYMDIYRHCASRLSLENKFYAEDITQEVFELMYEKSKTIEINNYRAWLYKTANNLLKNFFKKHTQKLKRETQIDETITETLLYEQNFETIDEYLIETYKNEILESLSKQERELFNMSNIEKLSRAQISAKLSVSENTVKQRLYRLNQKIKDEVSKKLERIQ